MTAPRMEHALDYMGLVAGTALRGIPIDCVFIGSCTNSRIEDLRSAGYQNFPFCDLDSDPAERDAATSGRELLELHAIRKIV